MMVISHILPYHYYFSLNSLMHLNQEPHYNLYIYEKSFRVLKSLDLFII